MVRVSGFLLLTVHSQEQGSTIEVGMRGIQCEHPRTVQIPSVVPDNGLSDRHWPARIAMSACPVFLSQADPVLSLSVDNNDMS